MLAEDNMEGVQSKPPAKALWSVTERFIAMTGKHLHITSNFLLFSFPPSNACRAWHVIVINFKFSP